ncbi:MAG TPA: hypothetical protein VLU23_21190 [Pseudolabrys sp.]|jgi:hypothetical protein|nr:hypothetical protein [Pseudolabrys sp.]
MASSAQLERKAERARERLSDRIADLRYHVSPSTVVSDLFGVNPRTLGDDILPLMAKQAKHNPIASALIAAGVGWLIFSEVRGPLTKFAFGPATSPRAKRGRTKRRGARNGKAVAASRKK